MFQTYKGKFRPKNPHKYAGNPDNIIFRSKWEYDLLKIIDESENIVMYASEEIKIPYFNPIDKKVHNYFPDIIIKDKNNKVTMIEIKPYAQTQIPVPPKNNNKKRKASYIDECMTYVINQAKWDAAEKFCKEKNWKFEKLTEKEIYGKK